MTSLRETGEKILLPHPIRQPARSRKSLPEWLNVDALQNHFLLSYTTIGTRNCTVNMTRVYLDSLEVSFRSTVNLFYTWMEAIGVLETHNMQRWPHRIVSLKIIWCFKYVNLLLILYLLYSIKVTAFHQSLVCFYPVINFIITVCRRQH